MDRHRASGGGIGERGLEASIGQNGWVDSASEIAELDDGRLRILVGGGDDGLDLVSCVALLESAAGSPQIEGHGCEPGLGAVVEISFDAATLGLGRFDRPVTAVLDPTSPFGERRWGGAEKGPGQDELQFGESVAGPTTSEATPQPKRSIVQLPKTDQPQVIDDRAKSGKVHAAITRVNDAMPNGRRRTKKSSSRHRLVSRNGPRTKPAMPGSRWRTGEGMVSPNQLRISVLSRKLTPDAAMRTRASRGKPTRTNMSAKDTLSAVEKMPNQARPNGRPSRP